MVPYMAVSTAEENYDGLGLMSAASDRLPSMKMKDDSSHMLAKFNVAWLKKNHEKAPLGTVLN